MKRILFSILLLCLCFSNLFAQRSASYGVIYPEGNNRDTYIPTLWGKTNLYYYISNSPNNSNLTFSQCQTAIQNAFNTWAQYSRFTFTQTNNLSQADIILGWYRDSHGNLCDPFTDTSVIAHATTGQISSLTPPGQVHFNDLCSFSTDGTQFDVESVALHEIGHVLGVEDNYTDSLYVMYYCISSGTIKRNLTNYDIVTLYNTYSHPYTINGPQLVNTNGYYSLNVIPSGATVQWNLSDSYYNNDYHYFTGNNPSIGSCLIVHNNNHDLVDATLTATILYNNVVVQELTKTGLYAYDGFWGQFTSGNLSGDINNTHIFGIRANATTYITSPNFYGATVTYDSSGATPTIWGFSPNNGDLTFVTTNTLSPIVINVHDGCGNDYVLYAFASTAKSINVTNGENSITITLVGDDDSDMGMGCDVDQPWTIEVRNATTGALMTTQSATSRSTTISTVGWPKGIYIVKVTVGKEVLTEKVIVK